MPKKLTTEEFITKAKEVHGELYDYSKVLYKNNSTPIEIICSAHSVFKQRPNDHINGAGCPTCGIISRTSKKLGNKEKFIQRANSVHNNKYDYSKIIYVKANTKVKIICPIHGEFEQRPADHINLRQGCSVCSGNDKWTLNKLKSRATEIHDGLYDYSLVQEPLKSTTKIPIICAIHGVFYSQIANHINSKTICPQCAGSGFDKNKPAILYYLKITTDDGQTLYKIGITNRTVNERFNLTDLNKIEILKQKQYPVGQDAYEWEQKLLKLYKQYQYKGPDILSSGNTELFTEDIVTMFYKDNNF